ncbi:MAG: hypothetical protein C5B54_07640 [Acidobacteria bacterium]|nr:MAG: hypothetical protein C5B54_07640 [Acidobacteriota bacterium]
MGFKIRSTFWLILGIILILLDPVLAHLSNSGLLKWPPTWDMSKMSHVISRILIGAGIVCLVIAYIKLKSERSEKK